MTLARRITGFSLSCLVLALVAGCGGSSGTPAASLSSTSLAFSGTAVGSSSTMSVTLTNTGNATLNISGVTVMGTNASIFTITANNCGGSLAAAAACSIAVTFSPTSVGSFTATVSIADNASGSPQSVALTGSSGIPVVSISPSTLNFLTDLTGSASTLAVTLSNTGTAPLTIASVTLSGASAFKISANTCGTTLAAGSSCPISLTFSPVATGSLSASVSVSDNATGSPQSVALSGAGAIEPNSCKQVDTTSPLQPSPTANYAGSAFSGKVMAGTSPVIGASVQIYAAGLAGNGSSPTALLTTPLVTNSSGGFTVPSGFTCPYSNSVLYAVARGGQAGSTGTVNAGTVLAGVLGLCNSIAGSPTFTIDEVTTAATAWSMAQFLAAGAKIGSTSTNSSGIVLAAGTFANLANALTGSSPGAYFPGTGTAPTAKINQLANLLNGCIVSTGATSSACTQLYSLTATSALTPTNTLDAAMNLVRNPGTNVASLYALSTGSAAYAPSLTVAPADWSLFVNFTGGGMNDPSAVSIDSTGRVWVANYFSVASLFSNTGTPVFANGITGNSLYNSYGGGVDVNDVMWVANEEGGPTGLGTITLLTSGGASPATYTAGGLNFPIAVAFDTSGVSWVVDYGDSQMTLLSNSGSPLSGTTGYSSAQFEFPVALATDGKCNAFVANQSSDTITFISADGSIVASYATGSGPSGVAVDSSNNVWVANYYGNSVGMVASAGAIASGPGYTGGGIDHPQGIAVDGAGTVWVANYRSPSNVGNAITELAGAATANPGSALSPTTGWATDAGLLESFGLAIDAAGNIWVTSFGNNMLTEFIGMGTPVKTPLLGPVRIP